MSVSIPLDAGVGEEEQTETEIIMMQQGAKMQEGSVHFCQGPLQRKRHKAQAKIKKWKQKWFKLQPGKNNYLFFSVRARFFAYALIELCSSRNLQLLLSPSFSPSPQRYISVNGVQGRGAVYYGQTDSLPACR